MLPPAPLACAVYGVSELLLALRKRAGSTAERSDRGSLAVFWIVITLGLLASVVSAAMFPQFEFHLHRALLIGVATLSAAGLALRWWAIFVLGRWFTVDAAAEGALHDGQSVLAGEVLVGTVEQVGTHTARVRLLTDRQAPLSVRIARPEADRYLPLDAEFWLVGTGAGNLEVRDVNHRFIRAGSIREGDVVLSDPQNPKLPVALTVGTVKAVHVDPDNPLLYRLTVEPPVQASDLRSVFVVDLGPNEPA